MRNERKQMMKLASTNKFKNENGRSIGLELTTDTYVAAFSESGPSEGDVAFE